MQSYEDASLIRTRLVADPLGTRWGGLAALGGGTLMAVDLVLHLFVDDRLRPVPLAGIPHEAWHVPGIIALPLALLGLIAIHGAHSRETERLGAWGFGLLVLGMTVGAIYSTVFHGLFLPAIEAVEPGLFETLVDNVTAAQFYRGVVVQGLGLGLGAVLFGVATVRARVFPTWTGWVMILAAVFAGANQLHESAQLVSRTLFALAFIWYGLALRQLVNRQTG
jgi:hypothetical protein